MIILLYIINEQSGLVPEGAVGARPWRPTGASLDSGAQPGRV